MIVDTRKKLISEWGAEGITYFEESIWSSSIMHSDLPRVRDFLKVNNFKYFDISIVRPQDDSIERMKFRTHYSEDGQCFSTNYGITVPKNSNNLKLTIGLEGEVKNQECQDKTLYIINSLRIIFGIPIARELMQVSNFDSKNYDVAGHHSELGYASKFDIQDLNLYESIEYCQLRELPVDALILLDKAFQQRFPDERFILMWVAFEAIINSLPNLKMNGNKRQKYFQEELASEIVNKEIIRLRDFRHIVFKEAKFEEAKVEEINWSLYMAIQLAMLSDCPQRQAFLNGYEQYILSRS
ncbi:hypothetical protein M0D70_02805 [Acinetobacter portensis]|uniref:ApeA N-terminal domain-containing protein n=2 Tax=Acinetobacter TaxID=469 RepID=A0A6L6GGV5_9GAMM|nr:MULTISPECIES: hypothetical protein [Acinetobacter]MCK7608357.1 hypothetical protein [Acinetobacter portensis]MCK7639108.1 hypothetical protein [Acinetobacter portensis]MDY6483253.1 hypothetical protein [Acinetobacter faecalis]MDY6486645.1 hypothetical protein [Acinetobacter faecalis]MDY6523165.1 hypothetical protein [Acinetobacter faecalis]